MKFGDVPAEITGIDSYGMVTNPIIFQSCEIRNVKCKLVNINNKKYAVQNLIIRDCIVEAHQVGGDSGDFIDFNKQNSFIKDLEISSSTFYSHTRVNPRFLRYSNGNATKAGWTCLYDDILRIIPSIISHIMDKVSTAIVGQEEITQ